MGIGYSSSLQYPIRLFDDKAVLRTDQSLDQTVAYYHAERVFDPNDTPTQETTPLYGSLTPHVKKVFHQVAQMLTTWDAGVEDPSQQVAAAYLDINGLTNPSSIPGLINY